MKVSRKELRLKQAGAFRKGAATLVSQIEAKRHPAISEQNLTARRARIASSMGNDTDHLERIKQALEGMATDLERNQLPMILRPVTTRGMVEALLQKRWPTPGVHKSHVRDVLRICKKSRETAVLEAHGWLRGGGGRPDTAGSNVRPGRSRRLLPAATGRAPPKIPSVDRGELC